MSLAIVHFHWWNKILLTWWQGCQQQLRWLGQCGSWGACHGSVGTGPDHLSVEEDSILWVLLIFKDASEIRQTVKTTDSFLVIFSTSLSPSSVIDHHSPQQFFLFPSFVPHFRWCLVDFCWQLQSISLLHDCTHKTNKNVGHTGRISDAPTKQYFTQWTSALPLR